MAHIFVDEVKTSEILEDNKRKKHFISLIFKQIEQKRNAHKKKPEEEQGVGAWTPPPNFTNFQTLIITEVFTRFLKQIDIR